VCYYIESGGISNGDWCNLSEEQIQGQVMLQKFGRLRFIVAPPGSQVERILRLAKRGVQVWKHEGLRALIVRFSAKVRSHWQRGAPPRVVSLSAYTYDSWIRDHEPDTAELGRQRQMAQTFPYQPLISLITPVFNPSPQILHETIESVLAQTYPHWELCLVNGGSDVPGVKDVLDQFAAKDRRIRVRHLERNLGIAGNSNQALQMAQGAYVALLDHDDLVASNMLFEVVSVLNEHPEADIIYADEDKISEDGTVRREPWFKPGGWSPDLLLSTNYLMHSAIRRSLLEEVGGFDPVMDGAQDWDLAIRCTERTKRIFHIPKVLYHWRQVKGSAAQDANAKPWAFAATERCIKAHLERLGLKQPRIVFPSVGRVRIIWQTSGAKVSIIIPTKDRAELLQACLTSILNQTTYPNYEVILIDTGSTQPETRHLYAELAADAHVRIVDYQGSFNYSLVNNLGARYASGDLLLFLNNDTQILEADWLNELVGWAERPEVGIVGCKLLRLDGTIQHAGIIMGVEGHGSHVFDGDREDTYGVFGSSEWYRDYMAVTGACMMMRRDVFEELHGFDEAYEVGYSDIELCLRAFRRGYRVIYTPFARVLHREGGTRGFFVPPNDVLRAYFQMLSTVRAGDPFFNPNLSYIHRRPAIAQPGEESRDERLERILKEFGLLHGNGAGHFESLVDLPPLSQGGLTRREPEVGQAKRLLLVTHDLALNGAPLFLYRLAKYLVRNGYSATVLSPHAGPLQRLYKEANIPVIVEPTALDDARVAFSLLNDYDVTLVNTILAWRSVYAAKASQKRCVWLIHESKFGREFASSNVYVARALERADAVVFPCRASAALYTEFCTRNNFIPIHIGLDIETMEKQDGTFHKPPNKFYVLNLASVEPRKGQDVLLRSIAALPMDRARFFEFYLVGRVLDHRFYTELTRMAKHRDNVHIVGEVSHERAMSYLQAADVFVLTSRDEALPASMLEAMYYGKGIIATNVGGIPEVIDNGVNGLLIKTEDHKALAENLERLFQDRELLQRLGSAAKSKFEEYLTMQRFGREMIQVLGGVRE
jgi:GT2 family glycosyltransferase/glycosyltransferase involved in cell wall biosynthesis